MTLWKEHGVFWNHLFPLMFYLIPLTSSGRRVSKWLQTHRKMSMSTFNSSNEKKTPQINCSRAFFTSSRRRDDIITLPSISGQSDTSPLHRQSPQLFPRNPQRSPWGGFLSAAGTANNSLPIRPLFNPIPPGIDTRGLERV